MKNQSRLYKSIAICVSVIAALAMLVPTVTSAVGSSASSDSNHNVASDSSSTTSTRSSSSRSASTTSTRSADDADDKEWIKLPGRNLKWFIITGTWDTIHLKPIDPNKPVYGGNTGYGTGSGKFDSIFGTSDGNYSGPGFDALKNQIKTIIIDEDMTLDCAESMFQGYAGLQKVVGLEHIKFADNIKDNSLQSMFSNCPNLETLEGIANWDISNVTNTSHMFSDDTSLKNIDLSGWQNVKIKNANAMFYKCTSLQTARMFSAKDGTLLSLDSLFLGDESLTNVYGLENWNTTNVDDMYAMFYNTSIKSLDLSSWKFPTGIVQENKALGTRSGVGTPGNYGMFWENSLRDITLPVEHLNKAGLNNIIWRNVSGKSDGKIVSASQLVKSDNNADPSTKHSNSYQRMVSDFIKVTFNNKYNGNSIECVADVSQFMQMKKLKTATFMNCTHKYLIRNDWQTSGKDNSKATTEDREKLALQAESLGLVNLAQTILKSENSSITALKNLIHESDNSRYGSTMTFADIEKALGIKDNSLVQNESIKWYVIFDPVSNKVVQSQNSSGDKFYGLNAGTAINENAIRELKQMKTTNPLSDEKIGGFFISSKYDATFTVDAKYNKGKRPQPKPQPEPTPTPEPSPSPTPEHGPDDSDILPDITTKPDLNINSNHDFVYPFIKQPQKSPQSTQGADVQNNVLQRAEAENNSNFVIKKQFNSNSGTCKCVCPTLPRVTKSHKSNKSARKSSNKAVPCKSGNNYSWLGIGGLIISWLIMLLIGFIVGYKMRKKRDDEQSDENQSAIKD